MCIWVALPPRVVSAPWRPGRDGPRPWEPTNQAYIGIFTSQSIFMLYSFYIYIYIVYGMYIINIHKKRERENIYIYEMPPYDDTMVYK